jgi:hypothetical protein
MADRAMVEEHPPARRGSTPEVVLVWTTRGKAGTSAEHSKVTRAPSNWNRDRTIPVAAPPATSGEVESKVAPPGRYEHVGEDSDGRWIYRNLDLR